MVIREMSREECLRVLARARIDRLACAHENQPYVVPVYLVFDEVSGCLYGFTTPGQKVEWMRANPLVCVEVDEIAAFNQWVSVIAFGRYEELPRTSGADGLSLRAEESPQPVAEVMPAWCDDSRHRQGDDEGCDDERERAWQVLKTHPGGRSRAARLGQLAPIATRPSPSSLFTIGSESTVSPVMRLLGTPGRRFLTPRQHFPLTDGAG